MDFGWAVEQLKAGKKVRRKAFAAKNYITMADGPDKVVMYHDSLQLVGRDTHFTRYRCVHDDFLGEDWEAARDPSGQLAPGYHSSAGNPESHEPPPT